MDYHNAPAWESTEVLHEIDALRNAALSFKTFLSARSTDLLFPGDMLAGRIDLAAGHDVDVVTVEVAIRCLETVKKKVSFMKPELILESLVTYEIDNSRA